MMCLSRKHHWNHNEERVSFRIFMKKIMLECASVHALIFVYLYVV